MVESVFSIIPLVFLVMDRTLLEAMPHELPAGVFARRATRG